MVTIMSVRIKLCFASSVLSVYQFLLSLFALVGKTSDETSYGALVTANKGLVAMCAFSLIVCLSLFFIGIYDLRKEKLRNCHE